MVHSSSKRGAFCNALVYDKPGAPANVISLRDIPVKHEPEANEIAVQFMLSPINPSDINAVQGTYPLMPMLPGGVPGHEGVGRVTHVGPEVQGMSLGDWVVPLKPSMGTWRQRGVFLASSFHRIAPQSIPLEAAAMISINPPSALAMLENFVDLKPGDVIVQNGANSAVGKLIIQLARLKDVKTVNIIRLRDDWDKTVQELRALGADLVTTENSCREDMRESGLAPAALGLNCVGGSSAVAVAKLLRVGGTVVTYGGMSLKPVSIPTSLLIFKDITFKGFWLSGRLGESSKASALDRLAQLMKEGKLVVGPTRRFPLNNFQQALEFYNQEHRPAKVLLDMEA